MLNFYSISCFIFFIQDIQEKRLKTAKELGADHIVLVSQESNEVETAKKIRELTQVEPDKTIDCTGFESSVRLAIEVSKPILFV